MNVKTTFFRIVVKVFDVIIYFNTFVNNQRYIKFNRLHEIIIIARKTYQNLIKREMKFEKKNSTINLSKDEKRKNNHENNNVKNALRENEFNEKNNHIIDVFDVVANFEFDFDFFSIAQSNQFSTF